jgi:hypothetical protein
MSNLDQHKIQLENRLAAALRENLKRRKAQARGKTAGGQATVDLAQDDTGSQAQTSHNAMPHSHDRVRDGEPGDPAT